MHNGKINSFWVYAQRLFLFPLGYPSTALRDRLGERLLSDLCFVVNLWLMLCNTFQYHSGNVFLPLLKNKPTVYTQRT